MVEKDDIVFYQAQQTGKGLPFAIVSHSELMATNEIFTPSLRDFHVIFWVKKGTGSYFIDFKEYHIESNSLVLISKDYLHYFAPFNDSVELQSIVFSPDFIYRSDADLKRLFNFNAGCHFEGIQVLKLEEDATRFLEEISKQMFDVYRNWTDKTQSEGFYHLLSLFLIKCEEQQRPIEDGKQIDENSSIMLQFNDLLETHFRSESKVDYYVDRLGLTSKSLAKMVKSQYHISTKAMIDERRVLEIKRQLIGTNKAVKEIAYELGFDEPTNMVKYFKKHAGNTPNGFRESGV